MEEILIIFGLVVLGIFLYAIATVWKKAKQEGFSFNKFFNSNKLFWLVCLVFGAIISVTISIVPDSREILHHLGFAVETDTYAGYVLLGIALAVGSDKTAISGKKSIKTKEEE